MSIARAGTAAVGTAAAGGSRLGPWFGRLLGLGAGAGALLGGGGVAIEYATDGGLSELIAKAWRQFEVMSDDAEYLRNVDDKNTELAYLMELQKLSQEELIQRTGSLYKFYEIGSLILNAVAAIFFKNDPVMFNSITAYAQSMANKATELSGQLAQAQYRIENIGKVEYAEHRDPITGRSADILGEASLEQLDTVRSRVANGIGTRFRSLSEEARSVMASHMPSIYEGLESGQFMEDARNPDARIALADSFHQEYTSLMNRDDVPEGIKEEITAFGRYVAGTMETLSHADQLQGALEDIGQTHARDVSQEAGWSRGEVAAAAVAAGGTGLAAAWGLSRLFRSNVPAPDTLAAVPGGSSAAPAASAATPRSPILGPDGLPADRSGSPSSSRGPMKWDSSSRAFSSSPPPASQAFASAAGKSWLSRALGTIFGSVGTAVMIAFTPTEVASSELPKDGSWSLLAPPEQPAATP